MLVARARIVFLGPSLSLERAKAVLPDADFRPPIRRDDLMGIHAGSIVGIIDGLFGESLVVSPGEIRTPLTTVYRSTARPASVPSERRRFRPSSASAAYTRCIAPAR